MKTIRYNTAAATMLAALLTFAVAETLCAEDAGVVRLSDFDAAVDGSYDESEVVIRGASNYRQRNVQTSHSLRRMFKKDDVNCDGCLPEAAYCAPEACAAPMCSAPAECCAPESCSCPTDEGCCTLGNGCCADSCDGCGDAGYSVSGYDMSGYGSGCQLCGGQGCSACKGRHGRRGNCNQNGCKSGGCANRSCMSGFLCGQAAKHRARNRQSSATLNRYLHCNFGCLIPDGNGGVGSPMFGHYEIVYPVNAEYADGRDGQVYAAQGYGGAVTVPLAPNVRHAYNYGWGIPSSRLTPVSNMTP